MKKLCLLTLGATLLLAGCTPVEQNARNAAATMKGYLETAQSQCTVDATKQFCKDLPNAKSAQNGLITAIDTYCGWPVSYETTNPTAPCVPVKSAEAGLSTATQNVNQFITEFKGTI